MPDEPEAPREEQGGDSGRLGGILGKAGAVTERFALGPARAVARQGKDALTEEAERAIDGVMAGPLPEAVGRSIVQHHVIERVLTEAVEAKSAELGLAGDEQPDEAAAGVLDDPAFERTLANLVDSRMTKELIDRVVQSEAFRGALKQVLSSEEVRHALMHQTTSFGGEIADGVRTRAHRVDDSLAVRRKQEPGRYGGLATRGVALVIDVLLAHLVFLLAGAMIGLVSSMIGTLRPAWLVGAIAGAGWAIVLVAYFVLFWSSAGQTPGMRLFRLRVVHGDQGAPSVWRSFVRLIGLALAIIPCFAGFVPVLFDSRRRALQDYMAGTVVVFDSQQRAS
jgi:uncharacterized RDD family membrane protein YckC